MAAHPAVSGRVLPASHCARRRRHGRSGGGGGRAEPGRRGEYGRDECHPDRSPAASRGADPRPETEEEVTEEEVTEEEVTEEEVTEEEVTEEEVTEEEVTEEEVVEEEGEEGEAKLKSGMVDSLALRRSCRPPPYR
ncbi:hypothetical protein [Streptomyces decoyicus]|uniref:hypothetical protein n=1 Tax=Streptomyces decoyicus TaxID=249567 RepID=UPI0014289350|nr:hypothetical protein [Streptomyces decoyicus]